jgi:predicted O-methyltransferase YrrM
MNAPSPEKVMQLVSAGWACSILGSAARHGIFNHLDEPGDDADGLAERAGISRRGAQALLDGLTGLGLLTLSDGKYRNGPEASLYLMKGKPSYLGGMAEVMMDDLPVWAQLHEAVRSGTPQAPNTADEANNPFWERLVPAIAALSAPVVQMAAERLGLAKAGAVSWLDVGGGSGIWSAIWLGVNPQAHGVQLDWPNVNKIARGFVAKFGVADRFETIDGDFHTTEYGTAKYDFAIYGHIAHQETPADNVAVFQKFREALKPGGTLLINDFILTDDRTGHPFAMMFSSQMLLGTKAGFTYRHGDYRKWLGEAGFESVEIMPTPTPATVLFAR